MAGHPLPRRTAATLAVVFAVLPLVVACTIHHPGTTNQGPQPTQGPFASVGTETIPAAP